MQARDVMSSPVISVAETASVAEVAALLLRNGISAMPVLGAQGELVGIVSEGDLVRRVETGTERVPSWWLTLFGDVDDQAREYAKSRGTRVVDVMSRDVVTVGEDAGIAEIAELLERHRIKRVPVVRDGKVVGIVSRANLLQGLASHPAAAPGEAASDSAAKKQIADEMRRAGVDVVFVNVVVTDGVAHLWGAVRSDQQLQAARIAAESVMGDPSRVRSRLSVLPHSVQRVLGAE